MSADKKFVDNEENIYEMTRADFSAIQPYQYEPMVDNTRAAGARNGDGLDDDSEEDDKDDNDDNVDNESAVRGRCTQAVCGW